MVPSIIFILKTNIVKSILVTIIDIEFALSPSNWFAFQFLCFNNFLMLLSLLLFYEEVTIIEFI